MWYDWSGDRLAVSTVTEFLTFASHFSEVIGRFEVTTGRINAMKESGKSALNLAVRVAINETFPATLASCLTQDPEAIDTFAFGICQVAVGCVPENLLAYNSRNQVKGT